MRLGETPRTKLPGHNPAVCRTIDNDVKHEKLEMDVRKSQPGR